MNNKKPIKEEKQQVHLKVDKHNLKEARKILKDLNISLSQWVDAMLPLIIDVGNYGGEAIFGITDKTGKKEGYVDSNINKQNKKEETSKES